MALDVKLGSEVPLLQEERPVEFVALQPVAIVDHVCSVDEDTLKSIVGADEIGGSRRVEQEEIQQLLAAVGDFTTKAGGSAANTTKGLASGWGVQCQLVGARGQDEQGAIFVSSLKRSSVDVSKLRVGKGSTGRCVILSCNGQRTMRTCLSGAERLSATDISAEDFGSAKWVFLSGYILYRQDLLQRAVELALSVGAKVALDLASFEVVREFRADIEALLHSGRIECCFCNEDEAAELTGGPEEGSSEKGLALLAAHCNVAAVTLGERGCLVQQRGGVAFSEPAASNVKVVDATGAGDQFAAGFLYGLMREYPLKKCAQLGCLAGGAVVQVVGAEMTQASWRWLFARLHGELAATVVRDSAAAVQQELLQCYALIERLGRGVVYYGSARLKAASPHWDRARQLGADVARLLGCTTWSGGGPGMMEAATLGAMDADKPVGGIRISREAGTTVRTASYLPTDAAVFCRFLSSRKVALVDAGVRASESDRTAYIFLPGGLGTMDELFEIMTLMQLKKLGSKHSVPLILCNYDGFYSGLIGLLKAFDTNGTLAAPELKDVLLASSNEEVLGILAEFYGLPSPSSSAKPALRRASSWLLDE
ncbi:g8346 [Coccomyxa elongata]